MASFAPRQALHHVLIVQAVAKMFSNNAIVVLLQELIVKGVMINLLAMHYVISVIPVFH